MTVARKDIVDVNLTRWYHTISRVVRGLHLLKEGDFDRKRWIEDRLKLLANHFAVAVAGFAVMDNHLHVLCRIDPDRADGWSPEEILRRWVAVYPPKMIDVDDPSSLQLWIKHHVKDKKRVEAIRERLKSLSWFMKALKEPFARLVNKEDGFRGTFWDKRFKSVAILDEEALLATCAYIDLNPLAAGLASTPESSPHTSLRQRVEHVKRRGQIASLTAAREGTVAGSRAVGAIEQDHWLVPIDDRCSKSQGKGDVIREGMLPTFSLGNYLLLVDYTGRCCRPGKARMNASVKEIFERLGTGGEYWTSRLKSMLESRDLRGNYFAGDPSLVRDIAAQRGKRTANLSPQTPKTP